MFKKCAWSYTIYIEHLKCKHFLEYVHLLLLRDIWWSKFQSMFKCWFIFSTPVLTRHLWQLKTAVFLHWCLICANCKSNYNKLAYFQQGPDIIKLFWCNLSQNWRKSFIFWLTIIPHVLPLITKEVYRLKFRGCI